MKILFYIIYLIASCNLLADIICIIDNKLLNKTIQNTIFNILNKILNRGDKG